MEMEALDVKQVAATIRADVTAFIDGSGPDMEAQNLELGRKVGLNEDAISAAWVDARNRKAVFILPAMQPAVESKEAELHRLADEINTKAKPTSPKVETKLVESLREITDWSAFCQSTSEALSSGKLSKAELTILVGEWDNGPEAWKDFVEDQAKSEPTKPVETNLVVVPEPEPPALPKRELVIRSESSLPIEIREKNDKHAVISNLGGKCVVMEWVPSPISPGAKELSYQSFTSFRERYANQYINVTVSSTRIEKVNLANHWLTHENHRQYEGLDLVPNGPEILPGNYLNLWRGWGVVPKKGSWKRMERHIAEVLADGNQEMETYIRRLTAWKFQNPGLPPEVALVLRGGKGAGKGAWGYIQMLIWGPHALQIFSSEHLCGKHNAHLQNKLFLFMDEAMWAGDRHAERVLKGMITEKWMMIEPKNVNAFPWNNRLGLYMSANAKWVVPASHDERRFAVNNISERWKQNPDYFRPLFEEINNGGAAAMLYDLQSLDLDGWHPAENVPQTQALVEQKMLGLTGLEQWYVHLLNIGELPNPMAKNPRWVLSKNLLDNAKAHGVRNRYITSDELGSFMREMGCVHKSNGKAWGWIFPPLAEAREAWSLHSRGAWEWLTPISDWGEKPPKE